MFASKHWIALGASLVLAGLTLALTIGLVSAAGGTWQSIGTDGGPVQQLATASISPTTIYARTGNPLFVLTMPWIKSGSGIWKSLDGGTTWQVTAVAVDTGSGDDNVDLSAMAVSADGDTVYAASTNWPFANDSRIWRSTDGGDSWSSTQVPTSAVRALAIFDSAGGRVVAGSVSGGDRPLFYSDDGTTWTTATVTGPYTQGVSIWTLAEGGNMYAGGDAYDGSAWMRAVYTSTSGITWTLAFTTTAFDSFIQVVADPSDVNRAYALVGQPFQGGSVYSTTNKGQHWQPTVSQLPSSPLFGSIAGSIAVDSQGRLYAANLAGDVYRSTDHGVTWGLVGQPADGKAINAIAVDPNDDSVLYFGSYNGSVLLTASPEGVYETPASYQVKSASVGFGAANSGLHAYSVHDVAGNSVNSNTVYAATGGQGLIKSTDGGQTWSRASEGIANWADAVAVHPNDANIAYFAGGPMPTLFFLPTYHLYRTEDGMVWEQRDVGLPLGPPLRVADLEIDPVTAANLYAVVGGLPGIGLVYTTTNSGQNWAQVSTLFTPTNAIALHPTTPTILYAAVDTAVLITPTDAIYKSTDSGANWLQLPAGISCTLDIMVNPISPTHVYATGCDGTLLKSTNDGADWTTYPITPALGINNFPGGARPGRLAFASKQNVIYVALGPYGLVASDDGGQTWSKVTGDDIPSMAMLSLFHQPQNGDLFLGGSAGLWKRAGITKVFLPIVLRN